MNGRYQTLRRIAAGGMATVSLARVTGEGGFERLVAIKQMHPHLADDEEFVAMFLDEARLSAGIRHPNVVGVLDLDRGADGLYLVMEYIDGPTLGQVIRRHRDAGQSIPLPIVLRIFLDLLSGLQAAHELRDATGAPLAIVHRDVSPGNVLVGRDGIARITDFGVARAEARISSTRDGALKGKLPYMSPEQLAGKAVDRRSDLYSAACVLWEMLTLKRAFAATDQGALIAAILAGPKSSPATEATHVPPHLDAACMVGLATVTTRYASAQTFADALEDAAYRDGVRPARIEHLAAHVTALVGPPVSYPSGAPPLTPSSWPQSLPIGDAARPSLSQLPVRLAAPPDLPTHVIVPAAAELGTNASVVSSSAVARGRRAFGRGAVAAVVAAGAVIAGGASVLLMWFAGGVARAPAPSPVAGGSVTEAESPVVAAGAETASVSPSGTTSAGAISANPVQVAAPGAPLAAASPSGSARPAAVRWSAPAVSPPSVGFRPDRP